MKQQKEDSRSARIKCLLDAIEQLGYHSDITKAVAVVLTLKWEGIPEDKSIAIAIRVLDVQKLCRAFMTYEERALAVLRLAEINGKVVDDDADSNVYDGVAEVLAWDDDALAHEIDEAGAESLNQIAEDYWGCDM